MDSSLLQRIPQSQLASTHERVRALLGKRSLRSFVELAWSWIEPREFRGNWHIDMICEHLEAVTRGEIRRLLINVPPRHSKSLITSVFWPAWTWIQDDIHGSDGIMLPTCGKGARFLCASYSDRLSLRDSLRCRTVVNNEFYRNNYGVQVSADQKAKHRFDIRKGGYRVATSVSGLATGEGGDVLLIDDPHNVKQAESSIVREETVRWFAEVLPTRFNDPKRGAQVVIMQRVHEMDVSGYILAEELGYTHLCLPARYEPSHPHVYSQDPRTNLGELLWPEHIGPDELNELEKTLGAYACTPAESPVLMSDLTMKPISEVRMGDEVVGFQKREAGNEEAYGRLELTRATVKNVFRYKAPVVKITLDSGEVIRCTQDHKWFKRVRNNGNWYSPATVGSSLARVCPPRLPEISGNDIRDAGWLSGFFDGEGSVSLCKKHKDRYRPSGQIKFYQGSGRNAPLCDKLESLLTKFGFEHAFTEDERKPNKDAPCYGYRSYTLKGQSLPLVQRFLHIVQPTKWRDRLIDTVYGSKFIDQRERVVSIEPDGEEDVFALETTTGNYIVWGLMSSNSAGQLQQRPAPREGGMFKRHWLRPVDVLPKQRVRVRAWDIANSVTGYDPDWTVGVLMSRGEDGIIYIEDVVRFRATPGEVEREIKATAILDGRKTIICLPQDPGAAGKHQSSYLTRQLHGFIVKIHRPTGDKVTRAGPFASQCEASNVRYLRAPWNETFLGELANFPNARHDDQVDAASDAFNELADVRPGAGSMLMVW